MKLLTTIGFLAGLAVATLLVAWQGFGEVGAALLALGAGVLLLPLAYLPHLLLIAVAWRRLFRANRVPSFGTALRAEPRSVIRHGSPRHLDRQFGR